MVPTNILSPIGSRRRYFALKKDGDFLSMEECFSTSPGERWKLSLEEATSFYDDQFPSNTDTLWIWEHLGKRIMPSKIRRFGV